MKYAKLLTTVLLIFVLTGCIGEDYDFSPPKAEITLNKIPLKTVVVKWNVGQKVYSRNKDILKTAEKMPVANVIAGDKDFINFNHGDYAIQSLDLTFIKDGKEGKIKKLDLVDTSQDFKFPLKTGHYIIQVELSTESGNVTYVGSINVVEKAKKDKE